ncbi:MAG: NAD(P)H-quinone oxidoreductase [bacterium]
MRAVVITEPGPPDVLQLRDVPDPLPGPGEVVIEVTAAAVNRADLMQRQGHYPPPPGASPYPGMECSGQIAVLGEGVTDRVVGEPVCALLSGGGYAERVAVPVGQLMPVPTGMSLLEAGGLPEVTCTVWSMVFQRGGLRPGESLLVHGGSSGIGTMAIQLAKRHGARVFTTVGTDRKAEFCRELGADVVINYRTEDFADRIRAEAPNGIDVILDNMGATYLPGNVSVLARDGRLVVLGLQGGTRGELDLGALLVKRATVTAASLRARSLEAKAQIVSATVEAVWPDLESGVVRLVVDRILPLEDAAEAHRLLESSTHMGKVLLQVR